VEDIQFKLARVVLQDLAQVRKVEQLVLLAAMVVVQYSTERIQHRVVQVVVVAVQIQVALAELTADAVSEQNFLEVRMTHTTVAHK
jgi:hypothetical protein